MHLLGLVIVIGYTFAMMFAGLGFLRLFMVLEVDEEEEFEGLDLHQHGERAIPGFGLKIRNPGYRP